MLLNCRFTIIRSKTTKVIKNKHEVDNSVKNLNLIDLDQYRHGRKQSERKDSVDQSILFERFIHRMKLNKISIPIQFADELHHLGLGRKRRSNAVYSNKKIQSKPSDPITNTGAGEILLMILIFW